MTLQSAFQRRPLLVRIASLLVSSILASCSTVQDDSQSGLPEPQTVPRLAQLNFGQRAGFGLCSEPNCPAVTRKTIATSPNRQDGIGDASPTPMVTTNQPVRTPIATAPHARSVAVYFRVGDASLSDPAKATLDNALASAEKVQRIAIFGRTDSTGSEVRNSNLASARAQSVAIYIRSKHPELVGALKQSSQGSCCYVTSNDTAGGRQLNRRVEVLILG